MKATAAESRHIVTDMLPGVAVGVLPGTPVSVGTPMSVGPMTPASLAEAAEQLRQRDQVWRFGVNPDRPGAPAGLGPGLGPITPPSTTSTPHTPAVTWNQFWQTKQELIKEINALRATVNRQQDAMQTMQDDIIQLRRVIKF